MKSLLFSFFTTLLLLQSNSAFADSKKATAIFAGGCFWCMEGPFDKLDGVISTISGYTDGHVKNPTYRQVSAGSTGHTEAVKIEYNPMKVSYEKLLSVFWKNVDPTTADRQFCDGGTQYRPGIYYIGEKQKKAAFETLEYWKKNKPFKNPIVLEIKAASTFYPAEDYHQDYYIKNPLRYKYYRYACGRDNRLEELWGKS